MVNVANASLQKKSFVSFLVTYIVTYVYSNVYCVHFMKVKYIAKRKPSEQVDKCFAGDSRASSCRRRQCLTHLVVKLYAVFQMCFLIYWMKNCYLYMIQPYSLALCAKIRCNVNFFKASKVSTSITKKYKNSTISATRLCKLVCIAVLVNLRKDQN